MAREIRMLNDPVTAEWEAILRDSCNIELAEEPSKGPMTFFERWQKTKINRPQGIAILDNYRSFLAALHRHYPSKNAHFNHLQEIWDQYYALASLVAQADVRITEEEWREEARMLGHKWVKMWGQQEVTPYLHIFIFHIGFFLEEYGGIEKFANFALEGKHSTNKKILAHMTSHFKFGRRIAAKQQLQANLRLEQHRFAGHLPIGPKEHCRARDSWAQRTLHVTAQYTKHVISATHVGPGRKHNNTREHQ